MPVSLDEVVLDSDLGICFQVLRQNPGQFAAGGFQPGPVETLNYFGIVTVATPKALNQVPKGDRVEGSIQVICNQPIYETSAGRNAVSDQIQWGGDTWRVQNIAPWFQWGYVSAICVRMKGD